MLKTRVCQEFSLSATSNEQTIQILALMGALRNDWEFKPLLLKRVEV